MRVSVVHISEFLSKLCLLVIGCVLMNNAFSGTLINCFDCFLISGFCSFLITACNRIIKTAERRLQCGFIHTIPKILVLRDSRTLDSRFDVCQSISPPIVFVRSGKLHTNDWEYTISIPALQVLIYEKSTHFTAFFSVPNRLRCVRSKGLEAGDFPYSCVYRNMILDHAMLPLHTVCPACHFSQLRCIWRIDFIRIHVYNESIG